MTEYIQCSTLGRVLDIIGALSLNPSHPLPVRPAPWITVSVCPICSLDTVLAHKGADSAATSAIGLGLRATISKMSGDRVHCQLPPFGPNLLSHRPAAHLCPPLQWPHTAVVQREMSRPDGHRSRGHSHQSRRDQSPDTRLHLAPSTR